MKKIKRSIMVGMCVACLCLISACTDFLDGGQSTENEIFQNNDDGYQLLKQHNPQEALEYLNKALEGLYKLDPSLVNLQQEKQLKEGLDAPLNNLSWAYHDLNDYEKALIYIEKSLLILPNSETEYINKGNALYGLMRNDEALTNYNLALKLNKDSISAHYGKGLVYYDNHKYEDALKEFDPYLAVNKDDLEAVSNKVACLLYLNRKQAALTFAEAAFQNNKEKYEAYVIKAMALRKTAEYEEIKQFYEEASKKFPENLDAQIALGKLVYDYGYYNESLGNFQKLLEVHPDNTVLYEWIIYNYSKLKDFDNAKLNYDKALGINNPSTGLYNAMANTYVDQSLYMEAVEVYDKAIKLDPKEESAYFLKLKALYLGKRNLKCISFGQEAEKAFAASADIVWYLGKCHSDLGEYQAAIANFKKAVELDPEDEDSLARIAYAYLALEDDTKAADYSAQSLKLNTENTTALYVKEAVKNRKKSLGEQIHRFFNESYLYKTGMKDLDKALSILDKPGLTNQEIAEAIDRAKQKDDRFTFVVYGEDYDYFTDSSDNDMEYKELEDEVYIRIKGFNENTDDRFIELLDKLENTDQKTLIIDLRGNSGGLTVTSNNMLDVLLSQYVTSTLIYEDGYTDSYYSDASQISFKKIAILVDEHSASASELLTLGLKTYLSNVTVIGRDTFGKGVGQRVFEDKKSKIAVFVVNHYWNVKQKNIMQGHIKPDVYVKGDKLEDFMKKAREAS